MLLEGGAGKLLETVTKLMEKQRHLGGCLRACSFYDWTQTLSPIYSFTVLQLLDEHLLYSRPLFYALGRDPVVTKTGKYPKLWSLLSTMQVGHRHKIRNTY